MSDAALHTHRPSRHARDDGAASTTRRWAVGVLAVATVVLAAYVAALVVGVWLVAFAWSAMTSQDAVLDVGGLVRDVAPALLVGWCTGLALSAWLTGEEALGPRASGIVAGVLGSSAGAAVLALTGLL